MKNDDGSQVTEINLENHNNSATRNLRRKSGMDNYIL